MTPKINVYLPDELAAGTGGVGPEENMFAVRRSLRGCTKR